MKSVTLRFAESFSPLLAPGHRNAEIQHPYRGRVTVKHLVEALGVPHTEVGGVRVNGHPANLAHLVRGGDRLEILPVFPPEGVPEGDPPAFLLDNHLGRLATLLRLMGFDTLYRNDYQDEQLAELAASSERILLTRDRRLLMRKVIRWGYWVRNLAPEDQLVEVVRRFNLARMSKPFQRCPRCNGLLSPVEKSEVLEKLEPLTRKYYEEFHICLACGQVYWKGSHYERIQQRLAKVLHAAQ